LATCTVEEVTPVWSLKALLGIGRDAVPLEVPPEVELDVDAAVVVVDDELVELHAAPTTATVSTRPSAVDRLFHEAERKTPP
jgi:hypothetical protein